MNITKIRFTLVDFFLDKLAYVHLPKGVNTVVKNQKVEARNVTVNYIRHAALEMSNLATEIEQLGDLEKASKTLLKFPKLLETIKKAAWELQNGSIDKVFDLLAEAADMNAQALLDAEKVN